MGATHAAALAGADGAVRQGACVPCPGMATCVDLWPLVWPGVWESNQPLAGAFWSVLCLVP